MNHEKAKWIERGLFAAVIVIVFAVVFSPDWTRGAAQGKGKKEATDKTEAKVENIVVLDRADSLKEGKIAELLDNAARKRGGPVVGIIHAHAPGDVESEEIADILNRVARKYGALVLVVRVDIIACPEYAKAQQISKAPEVVLGARAVKTCKFQGLWPQARIESKVDEMLCGLQRYGKGWRPEVKGMTPAVGS